MPASSFVYYLICFDVALFYCSFDVKENTSLSRLALLHVASRDLLVVASTSGDVITPVVAADGDGRVATCRITDELTL